MNPSFVRPAVAVLLAAAIGIGVFAACSSTTNAVAPPGTDSIGGTDDAGKQVADSGATSSKCKSAKTCAKGQVCTDGVCAAPKTCTKQTDCPFGQSCVTSGL